MTWLRELWTQLWITLVIAVVILALYTSLGRQLAPLAESWRPEAEQWLSEQLGQPVRMDSMRGGWSLLSPRLTISGVSIGGDNGMQIGLLEAELDVSASLFWQQPVFRRIEVHGVSLQLQQQSEQRWQVADDWHITLPESRSGEPAAATDASRPRWLNWLELQQAIVLRDWQLTSLDLHGRHDDIRIPQLLLRNQGIRHELNGHLLWGQGDELAGIRLIGSIEGPLWPWRQQQGEIYLEVDEQEWTRWIPDALPGGLQIAGLRAGARGWLSIRNGDLQALYLDTRLASLQLHTRGETLELSDGQLLLAGQHQGDDWHIRLQPQFTEPLPFNSLTVSSVTLSDRKGWQLGVPRADVQEVRSFLQRHHFLPERIGSYLEGTQPQGLVSDIRVSLLPARATSDWHVDLRARLDEISTQAYRGIPSFTGVSGDLHLNAAGGSLRVRNDELTLHLADIYPIPWALEGVSGVFRWQLEDTRSVLQLERFRASLQHSPADQPGIYAWPLTASLRMTLPHGTGNAEPSLSLLLGLPQGPMSLREQLVPDLAGEEVKTWLAGALQQGEIRDAGFALQTVLSAEHPANSTSAQLYLEFMQTRLQYLDDWPAAEQLAGRLLLDAPRLDVWLDQGRTLGGHLLTNSGRVRLRPLSNGSTGLEVSARLNGNSTEALQYFTRTPLQETVNHAFDEWQASGPLQARLSLRMPLGDEQAEPQISIAADLNDNRLWLGELDIELTGLTGNLSYSTERGVSSTGLNGQVLGGDFRATIRSEIPAAGQLTMLMDAEGAGDWQAFRDWMPLFLLEPVSGSLQYQAGLEVAPAGVRFRLTSDLQGSVINLPYPLGKDAQTSKPLAVDLQPGDGLRMQFRYNGLIDADLLLQDSQLQRGQIRLGGQAAQLPDVAGVEVRGQLATELNAEDWWDAWQRISRYQEALAATGQPTDNSSPAAPAANPLQRIELTLGAVSAWGMPMGITQVSGQQTPEHWAFNVDSTLLRGLIQLPHDETPLQARLEYLHFPEPEPEPVLSHVQPEQAGEEAVVPVPDSLQDVNPADFPAVDMNIAEVFVGGRHFGSWTFTSRPQAQGLTVQVSDSDLHGLRTTGQLEWLFENDQHQTRLSGLQFSSKNVGRIQRGLRQPPVIEGKDLEGSADFRWQGSPLAFNVASLNGTASLRIRDGLVAADGAGALRAFGALNFNSMARRLKLDFSDLYKSGVSFDVLRGKASVEQGVMTFTEPLLVDGPGGRFLTSGSTDLNHETLDMKLAVTFPVASSLPMVAVLAGFAPPVAASIYVTEKLIGDELSRFTSASYDLRGTWREPDMQINRAFDNKVDGSRSRSLKQRILSIFGLDDD